MARSIDYLHHVHTPNAPPLIVGHVWTSVARDPCVCEEDINWTPLELYVVDYPSQIHFGPAVGAQGNTNTLRQFSGHFFRTIAVKIHNGNGRCAESGQCMAQRPANARRTARNDSNTPADV